jgi:hypothetical protein
MGIDSVSWICYPVGTQICQIWGVLTPRYANMGYPRRVYGSVEQTPGATSGRRTPQTPPTSGRRPWDPGRSQIGSNMVVKPPKPESFGVWPLAI